MLPHVIEKKLRQKALPSSVINACCIVDLQQKVKWRWKCVLFQ